MIHIMSLHCHTIMNVTAVQTVKKLWFLMGMD